jgi:hypothetical protein
MGHEINNTANLLKSVNKKNELITWEKVFIYKYTHHIMNFEVLPEISLIKKYVCRPPDSTSTSIAKCTIQHFSRFELRIGETLPEIIVFG